LEKLDAGTKELEKLDVRTKRWQEQDESGKIA
jgi:hypothetical protein